MAPFITSSAPQQTESVVMFHAYLEGKYDNFHMVTKLVHVYNVNVMNDTPYPTHRSGSPIEIMWFDWIALFKKKVFI